MMTDRDLAVALATTLQVEGQARATWVGTEDLPDRDAALVVMRHATALRKSLEGWISKRALRTQLAAR